MLFLPLQGDHMRKKNSQKKTNKKNLSKELDFKIPEKPIANRQYKNTIFQMLFHQKKELLSLYNALNNSEYSNENDLQIVTLKMPCTCP